LFPESFNINVRPLNPELSLQLHVKSRAPLVIVLPLNGLIGVHTGRVVSMVKYVPVEFPASSVTTNLWFHSVLISEPLVYGTPSKVAPARFASLNVNLIPVLYIPPLSTVTPLKVVPKNVGFVLSIVKVTPVEFPALSVNLNT
jgi:hypothetical protein